MRVNMIIKTKIAVRTCCQTVLDYCEWKETELNQFEAPLKGKLLSNIKYKSTRSEYWVKVLAEIRKSLK